MNHTAAFIQETPGGSFLAMIRPLMAPGGKPKRFPTGLEAQRAATEAICGWINGHLTRDGDRLLDHRKELETVFGGGE